MITHLNSEHLILLTQLFMLSFCCMINKPIGSSLSEMRVMNSVALKPPAEFGPLQLQPHEDISHSAFTAVLHR